MKEQGGRRTSPVEEVILTPWFHCPQCNIATRNKNALEKHVQTAHSIKPTCNICHVGFHHQAALNRHKQEQHNRPTSNVSENRPACIQNRPAVSKGYCIFFLQQRGCKKGSSCDFLHEGGQPRYTKVLRCAETDQDVHGSQDAGMFTWRMER